MPTDDRYTVIPSAAWPERPEREWRRCDAD